MKRALVLITIALAGCGGSTSSGQQLTVSAAASLKPAFLKYQSGNHYSFAGSDVLAAQIRAGARPDVYAAANTKLPQQLYAAGRVEKPVVFAGNRLVIAVPANSPKVKSISDLSKSGVKIAAGSASVPIGAYARQVVARLPRTQTAKILGNIRSDEPDVAGVVGKVSQGAVDAGFVYVTDVRAAGGKIKAVELPAQLQPHVAYAAAVVKGSQKQSKAAAFVKGLLAGAGVEALRQAGFEPPPASP